MKSKDGLFKATYTGEIPVNKIISWKLKVETAEGQAVKDAEITVSGEMPEHGHGLPTVPKVTKNTSDGTCLIEGIKFSMLGWWRMTFDIKAGDKTDSVTFNIQVK
ncbi:MAG: FixH family protein [Nitrospirae bacterium]|nr:FixH family protein [Nitrospirota bacterium]